MSTPAPSAAPSSAPSTSSPPPSTGGSVTSTPTSTPARATSAELSDKLFSQEPSATSQHDSSSSAWHEAYKDGIHGVPVQELLEAISQGQLPEALHDKLTLRLRDGDREWQGDIATLRNGAMLREKFSQSKNQLAQEQRQFYAQREQFMQDLATVREDPEQFLYSMQSLGMPVLEAAKMLATQYATRDYLNRQAGIEPESGQRGPGDDWLDGMQAKQELTAMKRQQERQAELQQEHQSRQTFDRRSKAVQGAAIEAFKAVSIDPVKYPQYWDRAAQHLQRIYDSKPEPRDGSEKPLTRGDVRRAVSMVKQEIDAFYRNEGLTRTAPETSRPGATALDPRAGRNVPERAPKSQQQRKTTEEVAREMRERQGIRIR